MEHNDTERQGIWDFVTDDQVLLAGVTTGLLLTIIQWVVVLVYYWQAPPQVPLFYSLVVGGDQLANKEWLFLIPAVTTISVILSLLIVWLSMSVNKVFHQMMSWLVSLIALLGLMALAHIFVLVF